MGQNGDLELFMKVFLAPRAGPGHCRYRVDNCGRNVCNSRVELNCSRPGRNREDTQGPFPFIINICGSLSFHNKHLLLNKHLKLVNNTS